MSEKDYVSIPQTPPDLRFTPFLTLFRKELLRFWRVIGQTVWVPLINSALYLLIFGLGLGEQLPAQNGVSYLVFLIPGLVMMGVLNNAFQNSSSSIAVSKFYGDLEDLRRVPLRAIDLALAFGLGAICRGLVVGLVTFLVGETFVLATTGKLFLPSHPLVLFFYLVVGAACFGFLGVHVAFRAKNIEQLNAVGGFILTPLLYLGGVFFPLSSLDPFWQKLSLANPILYFINGVRYGMLGQSDLPQLGCALFVLATTAALFIFAWRASARGPFSRW